MAKLYKQRGTHNKSKPNIRDGEYNHNYPMRDCWVLIITTTKDDFVYLALRLKKKQFYQTSYKLFTYNCYNCLEEVALSPLVF